jgi:hypothetical protein
MRTNYKRRPRSIRLVRAAYRGLAQHRAAVVNRHNFVGAGYIDRERSADSGCKVVARGNGECLTGITALLQRIDGAYVVKINVFSGGGLYIRRRKFPP